MQNKLEKLIRIVFKKWSSAHARIDEAHPSEEEMCCFWENKLSEEETLRLKKHLLNCAPCAESLFAQFSLTLSEEREVPPELLDRAKALLGWDDSGLALDILLRIKEKTLELINTCGDVLLGQELVPAPVLRSRAIKDFKDEVTILKDFKDIRVEVKVENKGSSSFNLTILAKHRDTQKVIKDLRFSLLKEEIELESYLAGSGQVTFEHVLLGNYRVEISNMDMKLASIKLDVTA